ncbi:MAG: sulfurtransferase complex subunit TusD [Buchnera aphidicola (Eriosoma harunire)]
MKYTIMVMKSPYSHEKPRTAILFTHALLELGHVIDMIFFYSDGVLHANTMLTIENDEFNVSYEWQKLSMQFGFSLHICSNSANKRGLIELNKAKELGFGKSNINTYFKLSGLLELVNSIQNSDRIVQF